MGCEVLVIDADESARLLVQEVLSAEGHQVRVAENKRQGLSMARARHFDLIFCDTVFEKKNDGLALIKTLRKAENPPRIIMTTSHASPDTMQAAMQQGVMDCLVKPIMPADLLHSVHQALQNDFSQCGRDHFYIGLEMVCRSRGIAIMGVDADNTILVTNEALERMCGFSSDWWGKKFPHERDYCNMACHSMLAKTPQSGESRIVMSIHCKKAGRLRQTVHMIRSPLLTSGATCVGAVILLEEITHPSITITKTDQKTSQQFRQLIGHGPSMQAVHADIENLAKVKTTTLITGESGTGKELVVEAIHHQGNLLWGERPLVKVNCVALSETLLESELFGHVRGAFTGASSSRKGRCEMADGGILFLDEIGDISQGIQTRLLRVLQEKQFEKVGDSTTIQVDVHIIVATNKNLRALVNQGDFREDLYYRLNVFEIQMPPLRERKEDIPLLCDHFIEKFNLSFQKNIRSISGGVMERFMNARWDGNVRELEHTLERAFVVCQASVIEVHHLPEEAGTPPVEQEPVHTVIVRKDASEKETILTVLASVDWNRKEAAEKMGMSRATFFRRLKKYGIKKGVG